MIVGPVHENDIPISARNFERLAKFIKSYSGIVITQSKRPMLESRLRRRLRATGFPDPNSYCTALFEAPESEAAPEITRLIDSVTTNKTDFFREPAHFTYMCQTILPKIQAEGRHQIKVWSAACSIGAEPYTLAMLLDDYCSKNRRMTYDILATDICYQALEKAVTGVFPETMIDPVPVDMRKRYVMYPTDRDRHEVRISPKLRSHIAFARLNLMDEHYPVPNDFDIIFLRNILIYFDKQTQVDVPAKLVTHMRTGGHLVLGHSESVGRDCPSLSAVANTIFQKR